MTDPVHVCSYQGVAGSFSEQAARAWCGEGTPLMPCVTFADVLAALADCAADAAVLPIENSLIGEIPGIRALLASHPVRVIDTRTLPVVHALVGVPGSTIEDLRVIRSHPAALAQCRVFLRAHPEWKVESAFDTAGAVREVVAAADPARAAIAAERAARLHGAVVLLPAIQDRADNATRFALVRRTRPWEAVGNR